MYGCLDCIGELSKQDYKIKGVINIVGAVYDLDILDNEIPVLNVHGNNDKIISRNCDIPFKKQASSYNRFISKLKHIFSSEKAKKELSEAIIPELCGSESIHSYLKSTGIQSYYLNAAEGDHHLIMSNNNVISSIGKKAINAVSVFLYQSSTISKFTIPKESIDWFAK